MNEGGMIEKAGLIYFMSLMSDVNWKLRILQNILAEEGLEEEAKEVEDHAVEISTTLDIALVKLKRKYLGEVME
jgi:hypothetical protein